MKSDNVKNLLNNPTPDCFFILDIDSTLVTTYQRNQAILDAFIESHKQTFPKDCAQLANASCQLGDYGLTNCLDRIDFVATNPEAKNELMNYWRRNFFSNDFLYADRPTEQAVQWTQMLEKNGIGFIFLTARHHASMWPGTLESMRNLGFPINDSNLFLKKDLSDADEIYKTKVVTKIKSEQARKKIWFIDNEPVVLNRMATDHPDVDLIWFESTHSGKMKPPENTHSIDSFAF